jgi:hypothetical protein
MAFQPINLIDREFDRSNLFQHLPRFEEIHYAGYSAENIQRFTALRDGLEWTLLVVTIIRKDEDFLWQSARDLLDRAAKDAASRMRGVYTFDLLTFDFHKEIKAFNPADLAQVMFNTSCRLKPGEQLLVKYSSCYGLLQKMVDEAWGKIVFKTAVEVFKDKPSFLYTLVKGMLKPAEFARGPVIALVNDLSTTPLYDPQNENQKIFLGKLIAEQGRNAIEFPPEVYVQDHRGVREILAESARRV